MFQKKMYIQDVICVYNIYILIYICIYICIHIDMVLEDIRNEKIQDSLPN